MNALISILPVVLLFVLMLGFKVSGWKSALITLIATVGLALWARPQWASSRLNMPPTRSIPSWVGVWWRAH